MSLKVVTDGRGRKWEMFSDPAYFDLYCVKPVDEKAFNSDKVFHFNTVQEATEFIRLIGISM